MDIAAGVIRDVGPLVAFIATAAAVLIALASPFMLVSVVVNIAAIRRALDRIAADRESQRSTGGSGVLGI